jgi:prophage regulatory protein
VNDVARKSREKAEAERAHKAENLANTERLLRCSEVLQRVGIGRSAMYARIKNGTFPRPVPTGSNSVAWVESEIDQWIADRIAARRAAEQ